MKLIATVSATRCYIRDARQKDSGYPCDWNQLVNSLHREINFILANVELRNQPQKYLISFNIKLMKGQKKHV